MAEPKFLCDVRGMPVEQWLEYRAHGPNGDVDVTLGGSEVAIVLGCSPYSNRYELYNRKRLEFLRQPTPSTPSNTAMEDGHFAEEYVVRRYEQHTGHVVIHTPGMYQHADHPEFIFDPDGFVLAGGTDRNSVTLPVPHPLIKRGFEAKTTDPRRSTAVSNMFIAGKMPLNYEMQVRFYMAGMDLDEWDLTGVWGLFKDQQNTIPLYRDNDIEAIMTDEALDFLDSVRKGINVPELPKHGKALSDALKKLYPTSKPFTIVKLPPTLAAAAARWKSADSASKSYKGFLAKLDGIKLEAENELRAALGDAEVGEIPLKGGLVYRVSSKSSTRTITDTDKLKDKYPAAFEDCRKTTTTRPLKVVVKGERGE